MLNNVPLLFAGPVFNDPFSKAFVYVIGTLFYAGPIWLFLVGVFWLFYKLITHKKPSKYIFIATACICAIVTGVAIMAIGGPEAIPKYFADVSYNNKMQQRAQTLNFNTYLSQAPIGSYSLIENRVGYIVGAYKSSTSDPANNFIHFHYGDGKNEYRIIEQSVAQAAVIIPDPCEQSQCVIHKLPNGQEYTAGTLDSIARAYGYGISSPSIKNNGYMKLNGTMVMVLSSSLSTKELENIFNSLKKVDPSNLRYISPNTETQ